MGTVEVHIYTVVAINLDLRSYDFAQPQETTKRAALIAPYGIAAQIAHSASAYPQCAAAQNGA